MSLAPPPTYGPENADSPPPTPSLWKRIGHSPATIAIMVVNVIVFLVVEYSGDSTDPASLLRFGANYRPLTLGEHEYWRLVSAMFLHIGVIHLAVNAYFGFGWCTRVEQWFGSARFLVAYFVTGIVASLTSALAQEAVSAGASGALFGMIGVTLGVLYRAHGTFKGFFNDPNVKATLINFAILLVVGVYLHLDNWAHGGGLVAGVVMGLFFVAQVQRKARRERPTPRF